MNARTLALLALVAALAAVGGYFAGSRPYAETAARAPSPEAAKPSKKLLYFRNPMGLPDTSPVPKKDSMGMDYIPVYEGEDDSSGSGLKISTERVQKLGVRTQAATLRAIDRTVRAAGRVEVDERRVASVTSKFEGWVEKLHVNATGEPVSRGQALFEAYSPELVSAQREYAIAARGVQALKDSGAEGLGSMRSLADSSLARLRNWDVSEEQIAELARSGEARRTITFRSPASGIVLEKKALSGMRFMPGEMLYQVADLGSVWVVADVAEQDIGQVATGRRAQVRINAYPDKRFEGVVTYVYPTLKSETRTVPVRLELANPGGLLKPGMFAQVEVAAGEARKVVAVPVSAVIDSGLRRVVIVQAAEGRFEPRDVELGARGDDWIEVRSGVKDGEAVVVAANFLIDAESNLRAALGSMGGPAKGEGERTAVTHEAMGTLVEREAGGKVLVRHDPVASLKWPEMTMEFALANESVGAGVKPGGAIHFKFVERKPGEWVITEVHPLPARGGAK
jgi:Cu(I)/Ag(I) efflux system membrane fusion protein